MVCLHVDDFLGTGDKFFEKKLEELNQLVGFGSVRRGIFEHCGRQYEKTSGGAIRVHMKPYVENLSKVELTSERAKQLDEPLTALENHAFRGGNGSLQWVAKELLYFLQFPVKVLQRRQGQGCVRDLVKLNSLIDETKSHADFCLTIVPIDLDSCGLVGVTDASLGGVDRFGEPTNDESKTVKVYSQAGTLVMLAERGLCEGRRGKFNVLECLSRTIPRVCRSSMAAETRGLAMLADSMIFFSDALRHILGDKMLKHTPQVTLKTPGIRWPATVVTDARDVYDRLAKETGGLPEQKALTMEIAIVREWLLESGATIRWTADENMIGDGLTKDKQASRQHLCRIIAGNEWSIEQVQEFVRDIAKDGALTTRRRIRGATTSEI